MDDTKRHSNGQGEAMELTDIESLIQQVDVMVGVGDISPFPETEFSETDDATEHRQEAGRDVGHPAESICGELDEYGALVPPQHYFKKIELTLPAREGIDLSLHALRKCSEKNARTMGEAVDDPSLLVTCLGVEVFPGQVFARVTTRDKEGRVVGGEQQDPENGAPLYRIVEWVGDQIEAGAHVVMAGDEYKAERYGYLALDGNCFSVVSPLFVSRDRLQVHWGIFRRTAQYITLAMLQPWLDETGIQQAFLNVDKVARLLGALMRGEHKRGVFLVASGKEPVAGVDARVELLVPMERAAGIERPDGSVDFREVNYLSNVEEGQLIARRIPAVAGTHGIDVTGGEIPAEGGCDVALKIDKTVRSAKEEGAEFFYAARDGAVWFDGKTLAVVNLLTLSTGVNYETGNVEFAGEVFVKGSIAEGFSVRAGGDVTVTETVLDGAEIVSENGSITVGRGVVGRRTKITAKETVRAQFVHDACVRAEGDIVIGNYLYNAVLSAGGRIVVHKGEGARGGSILGGNAVAFKSMEMWNAGSPSWLATQLAVGFDPEATAKRERVEEAITKNSRHLHRILDVFKLSRLEPDLIRAKVAQASGTQRRFLEQQAGLLGQLAKSYKVLLGMRQTLCKTASDEKAVWARIKVQGTAYPGVTVRIGRQTLKLDREYDAVIFKQGKKGIETV